MLIRRSNYLQFVLATFCFGYILAIRDCSFQATAEPSAAIRPWHWQ